MKKHQHVEDYVASNFFNSTENIFHFVSILHSHTHQTILNLLKTTTNIRFDFMWYLIE